MRRAFELAQLGAGQVAPNPLVGCVIVHDHQIIGEGWHQQYGQAHAEVNAIQSVSNQDLLRESTLYVNLEPCAHFGKTPPCSLLIIEKNIKKVVIANVDPYEEVAGKGIERLRNAGCEVVTGVLEAEGRWLNRRFFTFQEKKRPYIILKWAQSADGFMAPAKKGSYWISSPASKRLLHQWRSEEAGILVGAKTVIEDNPSLTTRLVDGNHPHRLILERKPFISKKYQVFNSDALTSSIEYGGTDLANELDRVLNEIFELKLQSILVEGGRNTLEAFIKHGKWDEARVFTSDNPLMEGLPAPEINSQFHLQQHIKIGSDQLRLFTRI